MITHFWTVCEHQWLNSLANSNDWTHYLTATIELTYEQQWLNLLSNSNDWSHLRTVMTELTCEQQWFNSLVYSNLGLLVGVAPELVGPVPQGGEEAGEVGIVQGLHLPAHTTIRMRAVAWAGIFGTTGGGRRWVRRGMTTKQNDKPKVKERATVELETRHHFDWGMNIPTYYSSYYLLHNVFMYFM